MNSRHPYHRSALVSSLNYVVLLSLEVQLVSLPSMSIGITGPVPRSKSTFPPREGCIDFNDIDGPPIAETYNGIGVYLRRRKFVSRWRNACSFRASRPPWQFEKQMRVLHYSRCKQVRQKGSSSQPARPSRV